MTPIEYTTSLKNDADDKKQYNIHSFSSLDRSGLSLGSIERRLLMKEFPTGEKIYIHYPGKEAGANGLASRPWDFRPKLQLADGTWLPDLSFKNVWDDLFILQENEQDMSLIATIFFRMAFMLDCNKVEKELSFYDINQTEEIISTGSLKLSWYEYVPPAELLNEITWPVGELRNCSAEAYLTYNDYLAQNEDCKYFYRDTIIKNKKWNTSTGRRNNLLTHITVIAFMKGLLTFTQVMDMFQHGTGVAAIQLLHLSNVTNGRVIK